MRAFRTWCDSRATAQPRNRATAQPRNRATAQPRNRVERRGGLSSRLTPLPARSSHPDTRAHHLPVWLMPPAARSVPPAGRLTDLSTRLAQSTARLTLPTIRLVPSTVWLDELSVRLTLPAARLGGSAAPINHLSAPVNRPAARFLAKNRPKPPKTAPFTPPAAPTGQKATVAPCRMILVLTRHLTRATRMAPNPTTLIRPAATFSRSGGRRTFSPNSVGGEGDTLAVLIVNRRRDWPDGHWQTSNCPKAFPSPVGRERVRVRAFPFSAVQPTTNNHP